MTMRSAHEIHLPCELASVTAGRHFVRDVLNAWHLPRLVDDAQLATSELVANAVRHAGTDLRLSVSLDDGVVIAIEDSRPEIRHPVLANPGSMAESGRGLHIVAAVSSDWGIRATPNGKAVWFALLLPDSASPDAEMLQLRRPGQSTEVGGGGTGPRTNLHTEDLGEQAGRAG